MGMEMVMARFNDFNMNSMLSSKYKEIEIQYIKHKCNNHCQHQLSPSPCLGMGMMMEMVTVLAVFAGLMVLVVRVQISRFHLHQGNISEGIFNIIGVEL